MSGPRFCRFCYACRDARNLGDARLVTHSHPVQVKDLFIFIRLQSRITCNSHCLEHRMQKYTAATATQGSPAQLVSTSAAPSKSLHCLLAPRVVVLLAGRDVHLVVAGKQLGWRIVHLQAAMTGQSP